MSLASLITPQTRREHRATWYAYAGGRGQLLQKMRHTAQMRGHWAGYDVTCSCGWESHTGGATRGCVSGMLWDHRYAAQASA
jgi:hypothetical protein